jgi:hypothetical protein
MMEREQWSSFFVDVPASENVILADFNPDGAREDLIVVNKSLRIAWYDLSHAKVPKAPKHRIDAPPKQPSHPDDEQSVATAAILFEAPEPYIVSEAAPSATQPAADPAATPPPRGVHFDDERRPSALSANPSLDSRQNAQGNVMLLPPVGAVGTATGGVLIFNENGYVAGFRLHGKAKVIQLAIVAQPTLEGGEMDLSPATSVMHNSPARMMNPIEAGLDAYSPQGTEVELRTQDGDLSRGAGDGYATPLDPHWFFTLAALDSEGTITILQPDFARPKGPDGSVVVPIQKTLLKSFFSAVGVRCIAASGDGVVYYGGRVNSGDVTCVPGSERESRKQQVLSVGPSLRRVRAMDTFRHLVVCTRGTDLYTLDYRSLEVNRVCDTVYAGEMVHVSYPGVFIGCANGAIIVVSLLARVVIARTATYSGRLPRSLRYSWTRGILVVVDQTGAAELLEAPVSCRHHIRGPLSRLATARVLRRAVELESATAAMAAKAAEILILERVVVPEYVNTYLSKAVVLP